MDGWYWWLPELLAGVPEMPLRECTCRIGFGNGDTVDWQVEGWISCEGFVLNKSWRYLFASQGMTTLGHVTCQRSNKLSDVEVWLASLRKVMGWIN